MIASPCLLGQTQYQIDIDSTDPAGPIATEAGWTSFNGTMGNTSPTLVLDGIEFSVASADGSRLRGGASPAPNALTADFVFDDGPGQAIVFFFGQAGQLPEGSWRVEAWIHEESGGLGPSFAGFRENNVESERTDNAIADPVNPAVDFTFTSDGVSRYDLYVRENNTENRARLNAVRLTWVAARSVSLDRSGVSSGAGPSELVGLLVPEVVVDSPPYSFSLVAGDGDTNNDDFEIVGNELRTSAGYPGHANGQVLSIRLLVEDGVGGTLETVLELQVLNDSDGDGLEDDWELTFFDDLTVATTFGNNDDDLLDNISEFRLGTFPNDGDSDDDNLQDDVEDGDGVFNGPTDPGTDSLKADTDEDNVNDDVEIAEGTNPLVADSDGDTLSDGDEKEVGTDPLLRDSDGRSDGEEIAGNTDPLDASDPAVGACSLLTGRLMACPLRIQI